MTLSSATAGEKLVSAWESWTTAVFKKVPCWSVSPYCTCSLGLHVSTKGSLTTLKTLCSEAPASWPADTFYSSPGRTSALQKKKGCVQEATSAKEPQWTRATPTSPGGPSRFGCHGQCICHSVSTPSSQASLALAAMKSFIFLFISGLGSHFSPGQRPPSIIPMGEKVRRGKYILI